MTALVLSAGGMYGAYQAGAWKALAGRLRPDLVVGASVGALNAWAIAGGVPPEELIASWLEPDMARLASIRLQPPWKGCLDSRPLHARIQRLCGSCRPQVSIAVVATELPALRPRIFRDGAITWRHLAASCAVLLGYEQIRIGGKLYSDGGLLGALPLWVAAELGATQIVAVNALPAMPSITVRTVVRAIRAVAPDRPHASGRSLDLRMIAPPGPLGPVRRAIFWDRTAVESWIARGEADAGRVDLE
ncbi:MAG TPA: patatin-like phospholipase family protein [Bryobacteraceae bacterium]|nr:patatin-like phospholipase family protein [Bryobacteraceae bacterium]